MTQPEFQPLDNPVRTFFRFFRYVLPYWDKMLFIALAIMIAAPLSQAQFLFEKAITDQALMNFHDPPAMRMQRVMLYIGLIAATLWSSRFIETFQQILSFYPAFPI